MLKIEVCLWVTVNCTGDKKPSHQGNGNIVLIPHT